MRIFLSLLVSCFFIISGSAQTVINRGDFAIVAVNANLPAPNSSRDDISFVCFKDITVGTELQILDAGYENCLSGLWSSGQEGGAKLTRTGGTIPAGTVITIRTDPITFLSPDNNWSVADLFVSPNPLYSLLATNVNMNAGGDQIYFAQGGTWTQQTSSLCTINGNRTSPNATFPGNNGRLLFGFTTSGGWDPLQQSSGESGIFPGMECFSMAPTSGRAYNKYTGPITAATQTDWITRISNQSNWTTYTTSANFTAASPNFSGLTISVLPGGDIPTATWTTPAAMCSSASSIDLSTYVTGTTGGTFTGTGVSGNMFNPSGLNGSYNIKYTVIYKTCPIEQTNTIVVNGTPAPPTITPTNPTCTVATGTLTVTSTTTGLDFSSDGTNYTNNTGIFTNIAAGASYSITARSAAGCTSTATTGTMGTAPGAPAQPTVTPTNPTCTVSTGTLTVTSSTTGLTFSSDGINYTNTTGIFTNIASGASYSITAKNAAGCTSTAATGTMGTAPSAPAIPLLNITIPTCTVPTGTITVTGTTTGLTFSNDGVDYTNTTGIFSGINGGASYSITTKNAAGCTSTAATGNMGLPPGTPNAPSVNLTNPTCAVNTGTITVTSAIAGLTFSIDGTNYTNTTGIFPNIAAGASYSLTAKNASGCTSVATTGTMGTAPGAPAQPTVTPTNPTCTVATGTLTVTSSITGLTFSSDGTNYTNTTGIFTNIASGASYSITAKNAAGCTSIAATGTMGIAPAIPAQPTVTPTNPTCTVATGTLTVSSSTTGLTFSSDGTNYTNTTGIFTNIASGASYSITAKNAAGCTSTAATGTMGIAPTTPAQPTVTPTNPTCTVTTGTLTVTSSTTGLTFSSDGTNYSNTTGIFTNIASGASYSITAKNVAGCTSVAATGTIGIAPAIPAQPTITLTNPTCTVATGTLTVTSSTTGLTFSNDGTNYTNTTGIFTNIASGASYSITAKNAAGCTSLAATGTMGIPPTTPAKPTVTPTNPTCTASTGTLTVTSSTTGLTFSSDGTNYTNTTGIFTNIASGVSYSITAKNTAGCTSIAATGTMGIPPTTPAKPTVTPTNPTCTASTGTLTVTSSTTGLTFSSDGTNYTNTTGIFTNIASGVSYSITAKNTAGCTSVAATGTMGTAPTTPAQPTVTPTNPTCTVATGILTVTSITTGLTFSSDGTNYTNTIGIFTNIASGASYSITAKNAAGCTSITATGTMGIAPTTPTQPTVTPTNPTCTAPTGTLTVTSSTTGLTFSNDGSNYTNTTGIFTNIASGASYSITAKNAAGCISPAATGTMGIAPAIPVRPTVTPTNPTCTVATGTLTVTSSTTGLTFSSDGTNYTNTTGVFSNITSGASYSITAKNTVGCISTAATGTMATAPTTPAQPLLNVTPPTCSTPTGSVTVTNTLTGLTYSSNGTTYTNTTGIFTGIAAGSAYSITAKNTAGCVSMAATGIMGVVPGKPTAPVLVATNNCGTSSVIANGVTGTLTWSDGGFGNPRTFNLATTSISATQTVAGCISNVSNVVSVLPGSPLTPNLGKDIFLCPGEKATLDPGKFDSYTWQDNSASTKYVVTQPGTYTVTVRNNSSACSGTDEVKITYFVTCNEIYFPTGFSPNGDGLNDNFGPIGNLNVVTNYLLTIYNRYGELVFKSTNPFEKWNGNHLGVLTASANYVWQANFLFRGAARIQKGNVTIIK